MVRKAQQALPNQQLRWARKERGWTQQEVADGIGAPLALNVRRWERGMTRPSAHYVQRLCQLFDKSAAELGLLADEDRKPQELTPAVHPLRSHYLPAHPTSLIGQEQEGAAVSHLVQRVDTPKPSDLL